MPFAVNTPLAAMSSLLKNRFLFARDHQITKGTRSTTMSTSTLTSESWEKAHYLSLTLWDIDREFQKSSEAYERWLATSRRKRPAWDRFGSKKLDVELGKALRLSHQVQELLEEGIEEFGSSFEQGDCE
jgi:hypothetical protein